MSARSGRSCPPAPRWAWAEIDVDAIAHNVGVVGRAVAPAGVWAVVKADGYGHGAAAVARAAVDAGCAGLCVALTAEGVALRQAGLDVPILVLSEQPAEHAPTAVAHRLTPTVTSADGVDALAAARPHDLGVHLKVDTGMHRIGAQPADVPDLVARIAGHAPPLAAGRDLHPPGCGRRAGRPVHGAAVGDVRRHARRAAGRRPSTASWCTPPTRPAASPIRRPATTSCGPASPSTASRPGPTSTTSRSALRPALALKARVSLVKRLEAGERLSYGLRHTLTADANVATVPLGYADGVRRSLSNNADVLIGGRRRPIIGTVTMDQLMVDCGDDPVQRGDEVVLIGAQGDERVTAEEWGARLGSIGYEVVCGIGPRVPRLLVGSARRP